MKRKKKSLFLTMFHHITAVMFISYKYKRYKIISVCINDACLGKKNGCLLIKTIKSKKRSQCERNATEMHATWRNCAHLSINQIDFPLGVGR